MSDTANFGEPEFIPGSYLDVYDTPEGKRLWAFLIRKSSRESMQLASNLGHPALAGVAPDLLCEMRDVYLGPVKRRNRFNQLAGVMTKQIMEADGYDFRSPDAPLSGAPFSSAAKYRNRNAVHFRVYRSSINPRFVAVTLEGSAEKLPAIDGAPWKFWKTVVGTMNENALELIVAAGLQDVPEALAALKRDGVYSTMTD
jgi:hypothetical protein